MAAINRPAESALRVNTLVANVPSVTEALPVGASLDPHIGAFVQLDEELRLGVRSAAVVEAPDLAVGQLCLDGTRPILGCAADALELRVVQPPGRRAMSGEDYLRGLHR